MYIILDWLQFYFFKIHIYFLLIHSITALLNSSTASGQDQVIKFWSTTTFFISGIAHASKARFSKLLSQLCHVNFLHFTMHHLSKFLGEAQIAHTIFHASKYFLVRFFKISLSQKTKLHAQPTKIIESKSSFL